MFTYWIELCFFVMMMLYVFLNKLVLITISIVIVLQILLYVFSNKDCLRPEKVSWIWSKPPQTKFRACPCVRLFVQSCDLVHILMEEHSKFLLHTDIACNQRVLFKGHLSKFNKLRGVMILIQNPTNKVWSITE